jgi:hypothetical protein
MPPRKYEVGHRPAGAAPDVENRCRRRDALQQQFEVPTFVADERGARLIPLRSDAVIRLPVHDRDERLADRAPLEALFFAFSTSVVRVPPVAPPFDVVDLISMRCCRR